MHEDHDRCYRAVASRDAPLRRPVRHCGQRRPASTAGRRARHRPRSARTSASIPARPRPSPRASGPASAAAPKLRPGSREWDVRGDLAARALRAIAAGPRSTATPAACPRSPESLHVSERHLHRVLVAEVGAGPLALARTRRAQTARLLLDATDLPIVGGCVHRRLREPPAVQRHDARALRR